MNGSFQKEKDMSLLQYEEGVKTWHRPRHPLVALQDMVIVSLALCLINLTENWTEWYFIAVAVMFTVSTLHHWLSYQSWHHRLDRSAIQIMIAGTPLPYVEYIFANGDGWMFGFIWIWVAVFISAKIIFGRLMNRGLWPSVVYAATGLLAVTVMAPVELQSSTWGILFWSGVGLYALQLFSYNRKWFDFYPEKFGYREVQHLILLVAVGCHASAAIRYL
jgi:hemolysin III